MAYNLLICTSSKYWLAVDVDEVGNCDRISLEGNEKMEICSCEEISVFCSYILNYYNIEKFSDIPLNVKIVILGNYSDLISKLFQILKSSNDVNIIDAKFILSLLVLKKNLLKPGDCVGIECFGEVFSLKIMDDYKVSFEEIAIEKRLLIEPEEFVLLHQFDCSNLLSDEEEKKELEERYRNELAKTQKELLEYSEVHKELQEKYEKLEQEYIKYKQSITEAEDNPNNRRTIVWYSIPKDIKRSYPKVIYTTPLSSKLYGRQYNREQVPIEHICQLSCNDGEVVVEKKKLLQINIIEQYDVKKRNIHAHCSGRVFYLVKEGQALKESCAVAIITDPSDTREAVMKWYEKMR